MVARFSHLLKGDFPVFNPFPLRGTLVGTGCHIDASITAQDIAQRDLKGFGNGLGH